MPKLYEDDLRNPARDGIAETLAARKSPVGYGLEQAGRAMSKSPFSAQSMTADGSVPMVGGAGSSVLPTTSMQQDLASAMPGLPSLSAGGAPPAARGMLPMAASKPRPSPYPAPGQPWPTPRGAPGPLTPREPWLPPDWA